MQTWIDQLGDWNPQILREIRGRLKPRTFIAAIVLSVIVQLCLLASSLGYDDRNPVLFQAQWRNLWQIMTWLLTYLTFCAGGFYLVNDLTQEEDRGTLNFLRLSPRPVWQLLLGKLLGVPVLPIFCLFCAIPLYCLAAFMGGISIPMVSSVLATLFLSCIVFYCLAMVFGLMGGRNLAGSGQRTTSIIGFVALSFIFFAPFYMYWNSQVTWHPLDKLEVFGRYISEHFWYYQRLNQSPIIAQAFTWINLVIMGLFLWRVLLRRFRHPNAPLLSKRQSYGLLAYGTVVFLGFPLRPITPETSYLENAWLSNIPGMLLFSRILIIVAIFCICPQRQALLDWLRLPQRGWMGRLWADKSPILTTVFIFIVINAALLIPWALLNSPSTKLSGMHWALVFLGYYLPVFFYALIIQLFFTSRLRNPLIWSVITLVVFSLVPPFLLSVLGGGSYKNVAFWSALGYPPLSFNPVIQSPELTNSDLGVSSILEGIVVQILVVTALSWFYWNRMQRMNAQVTQGEIQGSVIEQ
jgi:hypothetical protein